MKGIYFSKCSHNSIHIHDRCEFQQLARLKIKKIKNLFVCVVLQVNSSFKNNEFLIELKMQYTP